MMQLSQVRYFVESARQLNFTRAAAICGVSQPALSRGIRALEREFGGPLLYRTPSVAVTDLGRRVLPFLQQIEEASELAMRQARSLSAGALVPVSMGIDSSVGVGLLANMLRDLHSKYSGLSLRLETGAAELLLPRLMDGTLDLLIRGHHGGEDASPIHRITLQSEECVVLHPPGHRFAGTEPLDAHALLAATDRLCFCQTAEQLLSALGPIVPPRHHASGAEQFAELIDTGCGWGLVPAGHKLTEGRQTRRIGGQGISRVVELVYVAGRIHTTGVAALIRLARTQEVRKAA